MNKLDEIKKIVCDMDNVVVVSNEDIIFSTCDLNYENNIITLDNKDVKIFYLVDKNLDIVYNISNTTSLTEIYYDVKNEACINQLYNISKNANVSLVEVMNNGFVRNVHTNVSEAAYVKMDNLFITNNPGNVKMNIDLLASSINCDINNVIISLCGKSRFDLDVCHQKPSSESKMITYAVSKNSSVLTVNTNGIIKKDSCKTVLNQKTKGIILDSDSQIAANPILEIDEYDVIASHGASIGAIDDEELYYLMSRGLKKEDSEKLIIGGLIYPFLNAIESDSIKNYVSNVINEAL